MSQLNAKFREENYALLLDIYYDSLTESIKRMGTNPDKCLKYADFKQELKKFGGFGLVTGIYMMIVKTVEECDILDPDEYCEHLLQGTPTNLYNISDKTMEYLRVELNALMKDLIEYGYIDAQRWTINKLKVISIIKIIYIFVKHIIQNKIDYSHILIQFFSFKDLLI